jgi:hypothetical protein
MAVADLFPETLGELGPIVTYESKDHCNEYGYPRVAVRLVPKWDSKSGLWIVGWVCQVDKAVDEWFPGTMPPPSYPYYRTPEQPASKNLAVACATAARLVKIVMLQMLAYTGCAETVSNVKRIEADLETQARRWFLGEDTV